ncbi:MAG: hypothetical protein A3F10_01415 [Coxiella sp. RIFCSPHIGHO2_12_FULL_42_15]|nr:MAG: hypothetical protein A3F10_01415 [Coxiella sp. RIFCSPHIGHO2_12_FULL_42_15]
MDKLRDNALSLLARREHSRLELKRKLQSGIDAHDLAQLLHALATEGLQSDDRFAENFVRSRRENGYGPLRIDQELKERGINNALIQKYLSLDVEDWQPLLQQAWQKKYHSSVPKNQKERARQVRFLLSRGFPQQWVMKFLSAL